jgi:hypothetical protein
VKPLLCAGTLVVLLMACGSNVHSTQAVRQSIVDHLTTRPNLDLNMQGMDIEVTSVSFRENEADATVAFKAKGSNTSLMSMKYTLERQGDKWVVKNKAEAGGNPHGAGGNPHGQPPPADGGGQLPAGHPPVQPPPSK